MPLMITGRNFEEGSFRKRFEAHDGDKAVSVIIATEALDDYGEQACFDKAFDKYAAGLVEGDGTVRVDPLDFEPEPRPGENELPGGPDPNPRPPPRRPRDRG